MTELRELTNDQLRERLIGLRDKARVVHGAEFEHVLAQHSQVRLEIERRAEERTFKVLDDAMQKHPVLLTMSASDIADHLVQHVDAKKRPGLKKMLVPVASRWKKSRGE